MPASVIPLSRCSGIALAMHTVYYEHYWEPEHFMVRKANPALLKPMELSPELEEVVGKGPLPRGEVVKKMWEYIKAHNLQNPQNKRNILADDKLKPLFGGKGEVTMFEMTKLVSTHLK